MQLSQSSLQLLETCPRLFQHRVLEQLVVPQGGEQWERLSLGSQFHQLMQQSVQGLPVEEMVASHPDLNRWFQAVQAENLTVVPEESWSESEHLRTLSWGRHTIVGIYDYLILYPERAEILDWKTYPKPIDRRKIEQSWQARLYPFLLAETSDYSADAIEMHYWFVQGRGRVQERSEDLDKPAQAKPQRMRLPHSKAQQEETAQALTTVLNDLDRWLIPYEDSEADFPQTSVRSVCESCAFALHCDRDVKTAEFDEIYLMEDAQPTLGESFRWDEVKEIEIG